MTAPAHRVLSLVRGMLQVDRARAAAFDADGIIDGADGSGPGGAVNVDDPARAALIAQVAAECGGEVSVG